MRVQTAAADVLEKAAQLPCAVREGAEGVSGDQHLRGQASVFLVQPTLAHCLDAERGQVRRGNPNRDREVVFHSASEY
jgi:hypothetical protein